MKQSWRRVSLEGLGEAQRKIREEDEKNASRREGAIAFWEGKPLVVPAEEKYPNLWRRAYSSARKSYESNDAFRAMVDRYRAKGGFS
jgi:hypothetical protein